MLVLRLARETGLHGCGKLQRPATAQSGDLLDLTAHETEFEVDQVLVNDHQIGLGVRQFFGIDLAEMEDHVDQVPDHDGIGIGRVAVGPVALVADQPQLRSVFVPGAQGACPVISLVDIADVINRTAFRREPTGEGVAHAVDGVPETGRIGRYDGPEVIPLAGDVDPCVEKVRFDEMAEIENQVRIFAILERRLLRQGTNRRKQQQQKEGNPVKACHLPVLLQGRCRCQRSCTCIPPRGTKRRRFRPRTGLRTRGSAS